VKNTRNESFGSNPSCEEYKCSELSKEREDPVGNEIEEKEHYDSSIEIFPTTMELATNHSETFSFPERSLTVNRE
jgi:hypothetical protein